MPPAPGRVNRGPAAAQDNRRAILAAARRVFAARGYRAPLSAIAREAGVGQGVLYRHFPSRFDLALAVFEDHFAELRAVVDEGGPDAFGRLWTLLVDVTVDDVAFVEMVVDARQNAPDYDGEDRLRALLATALPDAVEAGRVDPATSVDDVLLAWRMVFGIVVTAPDRASVRPAIEQARALLPAAFR